MNRHSINLHAFLHKRNVVSQSERILFFSIIFSNFLAQTQQTNLQRKYVHGRRCSLKVEKKSL